MKRNLVFFLMCILFQVHTNAQQAFIQGRVTAKTNESVEGVSVSIKGSVKGTVTDKTGAFRIMVSNLPVTLIFSSVVFQEVEKVVDTRESITIDMERSFLPGQDLVVSATRVPIKILESPVSIEQYGARQIQNTPAADYYSMAGYKKGIDITTSSMTFKTISTRGFNGSGSTRVNQLVDGMDNQAPGLNFSVGNFAGLTELDVDKIEILPGASSALYGPGGINGTILINSKNPFQSQGLSVLVKEGITNTDRKQRAAVTSFHDFTIRYAKAYANRLAFKMSAQYISGTDWLAHDTSNYSRNGTIGKVIPGNRNTDPNYDGVNVYGDETSINVRRVLNQGQFKDLWYLVGQGIKQSYPALSQGIDAVIAATPAVMKISRTGYQERDVIDPRTMNIKLSGALHYRLSRNTEAQVMGYWGTGNTVYTGNNRYSLQGIKLGQYKIELKNPNWLIRAYTTQENAGKAHSATVTTQYMNEAWKNSGNWYQQYSAAYLVSAATLWLTTAASQGADEANKAIAASSQQFHNMGRATADQGRPAPGSQQFHHLFDSVKKIPISLNGGRFLETSQLWMTEGQYNFSHVIRFAELIVGANFKRYILNSENTLFIDSLKPITINETGAYAQVTKKIIPDRLTISFSGRYDKNEDFKGKFTPRATAVLKLVQNNNLRFSYQTAYRFPSTQQKYIRLNVGDYTILGGLPWVMDYLNAKNNPVLELINGVPKNTYEYKPFKPESVRSFEMGYKGLIAKRLLVDAYGYLGKYKDFLVRNALYQPATGKIYSTVVNSSTKVKTHGFGLGIDYRLPSNYSLFFNAYSDVITDVPQGFQAYFNTPRYRVNAGFANEGLGKKKTVGFNAIVHWQDQMLWDGELANGPLKSYTSIDAQVNYQLPKIRSVIKIGATNITNRYYKNAYGNPQVGGLYYVSFGFKL